MLVNSQSVNLGRPSGPFVPANTSTDPLALDLTLIRDTRESAPFSFSPDLIRGDSKQRGRPLVFRTIDRCLETGDYSILGFENLIAVERKSLDDLFGSLGRWKSAADKDNPNIRTRRDRFRAEHERLQQMKLFGGHVAVVIEADVDDIMQNPPSRGAYPRDVLRTSIKWPGRYGVQWMFAGSRAAAEFWTFEFLLNAWKELTGGVKNQTETKK